MPEPTDHIILTRGPDGWSHRYAPPPTEEDGHDLFGVTDCCKRMICAPRGEWPLPEAAARALLNVTDCCDRPFATHGPKPVELPPYSGEHATCRKCGSKAVETKFQGPGMVASGLLGPLTEAMMAPRGYPPEWLARRCAVCRAEWDEATITEPVAVDSATPTPHDAEPWSVWGIGDTWWVHHSASRMFLPIVRGGEMLTPAELVEAGARALGRGGAVNG